MVNLQKKHGKNLKRSPVLPFKITTGARGIADVDVQDNHGRLRRNGGQRSLTEKKSSGRNRWVGLRLCPPNALSVLLRYPPSSVVILPPNPRNGTQLSTL
jgi:hypothetical protein